MASLRSLEAELAEVRLRCAQLEQALRSRVVIEQAKGILAARHGIGVEGAFEGLRRAARDRRRRLHEVAAEVVAEHQTPPRVAARVREAQSTGKKERT